MSEIKTGQPIISDSYIIIYRATKDKGLIIDSGKIVVFPGFEEFKFCLVTYYKPLSEEIERYRIIEVSTGQQVTHKIKDDTEPQNVVFDVYKKLVEKGLDFVRDKIAQAPKVPKYN